MDEIIKRLQDYHETHQDVYILAQKQLEVLYKIDDRCFLTRLERGCYIPLMDWIERIESILISRKKEMMNKKKGFFNESAGK